MRIRYIKPEIGTDEDLAKVSIPARFLFAMLPTHCDREGRMEDRPKHLKLSTYPWDEIDIDALLHELSPRFIIRYNDGNKAYLQILGFRKHQRPHPGEEASKIPALSTRKIKLHGKKCNYTGRNVIMSIKGDSNSNSNSNSNFKDSSPKPFGEFWKVYPKKQGKQDAIKAWIKLDPDIELQAKIISAIKRQASTPDAGRGNWKYFKHAQGWLNGKRWEDELEAQLDTLESAEDRDFRLANEKANADVLYWAEEERKNKSSEISLASQK